MREIKFRAWDSKAMHTVTLDDLRANVGFNDAENNVYQFSQDFLNRPVMQYTGLKDKNGIEIYEGDIVYDLTDGTTTEVKYVTEEAWFTIDGNDINKVIGNIYKSPELLK